MAKKQKGRSAAFMRSINPFLNKKRKRGSSNVARRSRRSGRRSRGSNMGATGATVVGAGLYGAARGWFSQWITPVTSRVPFGTIADEVVLLGASWFASKKLKGVLGSVAKGGVIVEASRIGAALADGSAFMHGSSSSSSSNPVTVVG